MHDEEEVKKRIALMNDLKKLEQQAKDLGLDEAAHFIGVSVLAARDAKLPKVSALTVDNFTYQSDGEPAFSY